MEGSMSTLVRFVATAIALNLFLTTAPSCGQLVNPTVSDDKTGALGAISPTTAGNTAFGLEALGSATLGTDNTAIGLFALASNDTGNRNTATGRGALSSNTTGGHNTAIGEAALFSNH